MAAFNDHLPLARQQDFMAYLAGTVEEGLPNPDRSIIGRFVKGTVEREPLSPVEILLNCENIVGAGENAGLSLAQGVFALAVHPQQRRLLCEQPALIPHAVNEILRWSSSATHSMRTATEQVTLHNQTIEPGDPVVLWLPSANRDEVIFERPDVFDVTRRPNRHLAFGAGPHACIGAALARLQCTALIEELMHSRIEILPNGPITPVASVVVNGPARLPAHIVNIG